MTKMAEDGALSTDRQDSEKRLCVSFREVLDPRGPQTINTEKKASLLLGLKHNILPLMRF
jgi:hypothetical protein